MINFDDLPECSERPLEQYLRLLKRMYERMRDDGSLDAALQAGEQLWKERAVEESVSLVERYFPNDRFCAAATYVEALPGRATFKQCKMPKFAHPSVNDERNSVVHFERSMAPTSPFDCPHSVRTIFCGRRADRCPQ